MPPRPLAVFGSHAAGAHGELQSTPVCLQLSSLSSNQPMRLQDLEGVFISIQLGVAASQGPPVPNTVAYFLGLLLQTLASQADKLASCPPPPGRWSAPWAVETEIASF